MRGERNPREKILVASFRRADINRLRRFQAREIISDALASQVNTGMEYRRRQRRKMRRGEEAAKEKPRRKSRSSYIARDPSDDESRGDSARNIIARNRIKGSNILIYELASPCFSFARVSRSNRPYLSFSRPPPSSPKETEGRNNSEEVAKLMVAMGKSRD